MSIMTMTNWYINVYYWQSLTDINVYYWQSLTDINVYYWQSLTDMSINDND